MQIVHSVSDIILEILDWNPPDVAITVNWFNKSCVLGCRFVFYFISSKSYDDNWSRLWEMIIEIDFVTVHGRTFGSRIGFRKTKV